MSDLAKVSVVMITHNRRGEVLRTLARLCSACECPPVYLVDNGSSDGTAGAARKAFPAVEIVRLPSNIGAAARTAGVRVAHTPYVAFCDDDTWWAEGSYAVAARLLDAHPRLAAVTGKVLVGAEEREDEASVRMAASPIPNDLGVPGTLVLGMMAGACMMRKDAYLAAGGYEPRLFIGGEELLLALDLMSAGWAMAYASEVVVHHHPSASRDVAARRRMQHRNAYWCAWLRRPWRAAARETLRLLHESVRDPVLALGLLDSLTGMAWVLRKRRPVPPAVESLLARVHAFYGGDGQARRLEALAACRAPR